jgi:dTDP-4-dehydrorhamnose 3,5-epimerase
MIIEKTIFDEVLIINNFNMNDVRGQFVKTFNKNEMKSKGIDFEIRESYYSISNENVIRGMHFQLPPHDHEKLVFAPKGSILDVIIDLRKQSKTYKEYFSIELSESNKRSIFIPKGFAHGFKSLENDTITVYNVSTEYQSNFDTGIKFNSFGFNWGSNNHTISTRDEEFESLESFSILNPF